MNFNLKFMLHEGLSDITRGSFNSLVAVVSIAVAISVLGFYYFSRLNLERASASLLNNFQMEAYIDLTYPEDQHQALRAKLQALNARWSLTYVSRQQAAERFSQEFDPELFSILDENPFPASYIITLPLETLVPESLAKVTTPIRAIEPIEEVVYDAELLTLIHRTRSKLQVWGGAVGVLVVLLALTLTYNAMRLKMAQQRASLHLMSLVGATAGMLRGIYWIQGLILGAVGGGLAAGVILVLKTLLQVRLMTDWQIVTPQLWLTGFVGAGLGWLGSLLAEGRYLKV